MKLILILTIIGTFSLSTHAWTLSQAFDHVFGELNLALEAMKLEWEHYFMADEESCYYIQDTIYYWTNVFTAVNSDPDYANLRNDLNAAGVPWDNFMDTYLKPGVGFFPERYYPNYRCYMDYAGGISSLNTAVTTQFNNRRTHITNAVATARASSVDYEAIYTRVSSNQQAGINIRCSDSMKALHAKMSEYGMELDFFLETFKIIFGLYVPATCP